MVFLGIDGNYDAAGDEGVAKILADLELPVVGDPVRSLFQRDRMVWAVLTDEPDKILRRVKSKLKKKGFKVARLRVSAMSLLEPASRSSALRAVKAVEAEEKKVWAASLHLKEDLIWVFHESRLDSRVLLRQFRKGRLSPGFYHQEIVLAAREGTDMKALAVDASVKLDLVRASQREQNLVLDLYYRDVESFLALRKGKTTYACPDVLPFLETVAGSVQWKVTLDNKGYPFVD